MVIYDFNLLLFCKIIKRIFYIDDIKLDLIPFYGDKVIVDNLFLVVD